MIEVQLPDGRVIEVDTNDRNTAAKAAKRFMETRHAPGGPASVAEPTLEQQKALALARARVRAQRGPVTDPALLERLNSTAGSRKRVTDPELLNRLNAAEGQPAPRKPWFDAGDVMHSAGTGLAEGVIGLAGLPGDVQHLADRFAGFVLNPAFRAIGAAMGKTPEQLVP